MTVYVTERGMPLRLLELAVQAQASTRACGSQKQLYAGAHSNPPDPSATSDTILVEGLGTSRR